MPAEPIEEHRELQVVRAAEPLDGFFRREFPKMVDVTVACAVSGSKCAAEELVRAVSRVAKGPLSSPTSSCSVCSQRGPVKVSGVVSGVVSCRRGRVTRARSNPYRSFRP